jgi:CubicO group peptidase (beta-lactamase class C family)
MPVDMISYKHGNIQRYGSIWYKIPQAPQWASWRDQSATAYDAKNNEMRQGGYRPTDIEVYASATGTRFASSWIKNTENIVWELARHIRRDQFSQHFQNYKNAGYRLYDIEGYTEGGVNYFATAWIKEVRPWAAYRDMDATEFQNKWLEFRDAGYRLEDIEVYNINGNESYAGIWVANDFDRTHWSHKDSIDQKVQTYLQANPSMGYSVAIAHQGKFRFIKGYGYADKENNKKAHGESVFRLASVSKAMTSILGFMLEDQKRINLSQTTRTYLNGLPQQHTHTLGQILSNRSRIRHYISNDPVNNLGQVANAWEATKVFMNDPLVAPGYFYSTHGYTVFAAAIEAAVGQPFCNLIAQQISARAKALLRCENRSQPDADRSQIYDYSREQNQFTLVNNPDNLSWKYAGGGMESTVVDLAKIGNALINQTFMSSARLDTMITRPDNSANYAFGWDVGSNNGHRVFAKNGGQAGSRAHMRVYPDDQLVIVIMGNTSGDDDYVDLARDIAQEIY